MNARNPRRKGKAQPDGTTTTSASDSSQPTGHVAALMACRTASDLTARQHAALLALLKGRVHREELDRACESSNSPQAVFELRDMGIDIICDRIAVTNRHGKVVRPGVYRLSSEGRALAQQMFRGPTPAVQRSAPDEAM